MPRLGQELRVSAAFFCWWEGAAVKPCAEEQRVAAFILHLPEARVPVHLVEREQLGALAAADSQADESETGLGGWWLPSGCQLDVAQIRWFSFRVRRADLPHGFTPGEKGAQKPSLQALICALEALARLILLALQRQHGFGTNAKTVLLFGISVTSLAWSELPPTAFP